VACTRTNLTLFLSNTNFGFLYLLPPFFTSRYDISEALKTEGRITADCYHAGERQ
jgi:hypothetical protein